MRVRAVVDGFTARVPDTLPEPDSDTLPQPGRYVRVTAENAVQVYCGGRVYNRDAKQRITARMSGMPQGWCVRFLAIEVTAAACRTTNPGSRADPAVLRLQRQMADPAVAAALAAPLRSLFPGRSVQSETQSLFVPAGLVFIREASTVVPLSDDPADDDALIDRFAAAAAAVGPTGLPSPVRTGRRGREVEPEPPVRRHGHLRIIQ